MTLKCLLPLTGSKKEGANQKDRHKKTYVWLLGFEPRSPRPQRGILTTKLQPLCGSTVLQFYNSEGTLNVGQIDPCLGKREFEPDVNRTRNLLIWSQTRYHCATDPRCSVYIVYLVLLLVYSFVFKVLRFKLYQ